MKEGRAITKYTYRAIEITETSPNGIDAPIRNDLARAAETTPGLDWFEVQAVRGYLEKRAITHFQVMIKIGFRSEDA